MLDFPLMIGLFLIEFKQGNNFSIGVKNKVTSLETYWQPCNDYLGDREKSPLLRGVHYGEVGL